MKELAFSVTAADCRWDYFKSSGPGGQKKNKTASSVRVVHEPSGAVGQATESRSQLQNRKVAFRRMTETANFKGWVALQLSEGPTPEERVAKDMAPDNLLVEVRESDKWVPAD